MGDKSSWCLSQQLRKADETRFIENIRASDSAVITDSIAINQVFADFFKSIYTSNNLPFLMDISNYLNQTYLSRLLERNKF